MIIYFSGTGNSLATARKIAEATGDKVMRMAEAVGQDLSITADYDGIGAKGSKFAFYL